MMNPQDKAKKLVFIQIQRKEVEKLSKAITTLAKDFPDYFFFVLPLDSKIMSQEEVIRLLEVIKK